MRSALATALLLLFALPALAAGPSVRGHCVEVVDGDSLKVDVGGRVESVRLLGLDAPEYDQAPWGELAKERLRELCEGQEVLLEVDVDPRDHYHRLLAWVWRGDQLVNAQLIDEGLAVLYTWPPNVGHTSQLKAAQARAREESRGFWADGGLKTSPQKWRGRRK
jgi:micrococcal nuclease